MKNRYQIHRGVHFDLLIEEMIPANPQYWHQLFHSEDMRVVFFDVDGTLEPNRTAPFSANTVELLVFLMKTGFTVVFASNTSRNLLRIAADSSDELAKCVKTGQLRQAKPTGWGSWPLVKLLYRKPFQRYVRDALSIGGFPASQCVMVGDKFIMDISPFLLAGWGLVIQVRPIGPDMRSVKLLRQRWLETRRMKAIGAVRPADWQ